MNRSLLLLFIAMTIFSSCKKRQGETLELIKQDMQEMGYTGKYEKPSNAMEKAALGFVGIKDFLLYTDNGNDFLILEFKEEDSGVLTQERLLKLIKMVGENSDFESDQSIEEIIENIDDYSYKHGKTLIFWKDQKPEKIIKALKKL